MYQDQGLSESLFSVQLVSINQPNLSHPVKNRNLVWQGHYQQRKGQLCHHNSLHYINESQGTVWGNNGNGTQQGSEAQGAAGTQLCLTWTCRPTQSEQSIQSALLRGHFPSMTLLLSCFLHLWLILSSSTILFMDLIFDTISLKSLLVLCLSSSCPEQGKNGNQIINNDRFKKDIEYLYCFSSGPQMKLAQQKWVIGVGLIPCRRV